MKRTFIFFLLFFPIFICAENEIRMRALENRVSNLETSASGRPYDPITPCAGPKVRKGMDVNLFTSFLLWTARLDTLTYAKTGLGDLTDNQNPNRGEVQSVDWAWDPGFKAGIGWTFCHGCWDALLQYTWFYTNVSNRKTSSSIQPGFEIRSHSFLPTDRLLFSSANAHFDLHYQVGDFELGRNFYVSRYLKIRPFVGIKGTWQKQDYNVSYSTISIDSSSYNFRAHFDHALWGLGMRGGLATAWQFSKTLSLFGDFALSGLWLHYNTSRVDSFYTIFDSTNVTGPGIRTVNIEDRLRIVKTVLEFNLGLRLESYFACGRYHFLLQAGWESQVWINQTLYISLEDNFDRFDLMLQGLTTKIRFDF